MHAIQWAMWQLIIIKNVETLELAEESRVEQLMAPTKLRRILEQHIQNEISVPTSLDDEESAPRGSIDGADMKTQSPANKQVVCNSLSVHLLECPSLS